MLGLSNLFHTASIVSLQKSLTQLGIAFKGPLRTPKSHSIFLIDHQIFLESELRGLWKNGELTRKGLARLAGQIPGRA